MKIKIMTMALLLTRICLGHAQGFVNLDFEAANLTGYSPGEVVPAANAFPSWTVSVLAPYVAYDSVSLSGASISIFDSKPPMSYPPIHGIYFVNMRGHGTGDGFVSIGQIGQVPLSAASIGFYGNIGSMQISFDGHPLAFSVTGSTANYSMYRADISAYAGQTGQLLFSVPPETRAILDNIRFFTTSVPEPNVMAIFALGALAFAWHRRKSQ